MNTLPDFLLSRKDTNAKTKQLLHAEEGYRPLMAIWLLELALMFGWYKKNRSRRWVMEDEEFSIITGIKIAPSDDRDDETIVVNGKEIRHTDAAIAGILKKRITCLCKQPIVDSMSLFKNIDLLGDVIGLNQSERAILCFTAIMHVFQSFRDVIACASQKITTHDVGAIIAYLSGQNEAEVMGGLRQDSTLIAAGVIEVETHSRDLEDRLSLLKGLGSLLTQEHEDVEALIGRFLKKASAPNLQLLNFPHLSQDAQTLDQYLKQVMRSREQGTNVLLYGIPGTGKTEFVKSLAMKLGADLYEISFSDDDGDPITGKARLRAYNLCQRILSHKSDALLMFDEVEDVFASKGSFLSVFGIEGDDSGEKSSKAWINRTLERNATPAIWITNDAYIDQAYLRRFDYSIRFPVPPQKVRMEIARHHLGQFNPPETWLASIAANEQMTPAQYERAAKVARVSSDGDDECARRLVEQALDRSATLLGQKIAPIRNTLYTGYDLSFTNTSIPMPSILDGLKKRRQGTFCFYGPAGTGKSELARHIADELGMPCIVRRASDILSMWVGGSERNIAQMFAEARQQGRAGAGRGGQLSG